MILCICSAVSEDTVRDIIKVHNCQDIPDLWKHIELCVTCASCKFAIEDIIKEEENNDQKSKT